MKKTYIFDLDGTLLDSMGVWQNVDVEFLGKRKIAVPDDYAQTIAPMSFAETANYTIERFALCNHGIYDWFDVICNSSEAGHGKSRPDVFLLAARKLGVEPCDCVVFEDVLPAVKSAKSIGMTVCGVYDKASDSEWEQIKQIADYAILDFKEMPL